VDAEWLVRLTASLLAEVETALRDVYRDAPIGSQIVPLPDGGADWKGAFRGKRGSTLVIEGTAQAMAAGMHPLAEKTPDQLSPYLSKSMTAETLEAARSSIFAAYGVLPGLFNAATTGPMVRESQRHYGASGAGIDAGDRGGTSGRLSHGAAQHQG
jgi:hypothetical protein